jgi:hypothetical protein
MTTDTISDDAAAARSTRPAASCTCPPCGPRPDRSPTPPSVTGSPTAPTSPSCSQPRPTPAPSDAANDGSKKPTSPASRPSNSSTPPPPPTSPPALLTTLAGGAWIDRGEPLVLLGDSGTGKSHLLIALGIAACHQGRSVRYVTAAGLVNELVEAADDRQLAKTVARYGRIDLICLDELGYLHLDDRGAELLFQVLTEREERASIAVATNAPFSEWGATFTDPRLAAAVVDRLTFNAHILTTGTNSYRLRTTTTR